MMSSTGSSWLATVGVNRLLVAVMAAVVFAAVQVAAAGAAEPPFPYPSPAFNFAHPANPHSAAFSASSGTRTIPLLVVYGTFTDAAEVPGVSAATIAQTIFPIGTAQTIADYFSSVSGGRLRFVPAAESQGTTNDGVVQASLGPNAVFEGLFTSGGFAAQGLAVAQAADPFVNYASFDTNGDGSVTTNELAILSIKTSVGGANCGVTAGIGAGTLDGKSLASNGWSDTVTLTNEMTIAHELAHLLLGTKDNSYTPGAFDILGPTCGGPAADLWLPNSFNSMHWGWVAPTVVTRDGYYNVNPGTPYLLYDPARGTNDYFLVENREATPYDTNRSDSGLVIWQVLDSNWGTARGAFELVRPGSLAFPPNNYGGSARDAWNPSDFATPQRTMTTPWADNSAAKVAVRAIGNAGTPMRAYFDVRGPGVLVDTYTLANSAPAPLALGAAGSVSFPVMNTGEQTETFGFTMSALPPGWTASTDTKTLAAGAASTATVQITPPLTATVGLYNLTAVGTNTADASVTTTSGFTVRVVRRTTAISYSGDLTADYRDPAQLKATLIDSLTGAPLAAKVVHFGLGTQSVSAVSDGAGVASA